MALSDYIGQELRIGPFTFEVMSDGIGVSTEHEYCGLLDNVYEETWLWLKDVSRTT